MYQVGPAQLMLAHQPQGQRRRDDGEHQRAGSNQRVVAQSKRQAEGQHADEMHGPDTQSHGKRAADPPQLRRSARRSSHPTGHVEGSIGSQNRHNEREEHEDIVVTTDQHWPDYLKRRARILTEKPIKAKCHQSDTVRRHRVRDHIQRCFGSCPVSSS